MNYIRVLHCGHTLGHKNGKTCVTFGRHHIFVGLVVVSRGRGHHTRRSGRHWRCNYGNWGVFYRGVKLSVRGFNGLGSQLFSYTVNFFKYLWFLLRGSQLFLNFGFVTGTPGHFRQPFVQGTLGLFAGPFGVRVGHTKVTMVVRSPGLVGRLVSYMGPIKVQDRIVGGLRFFQQDIGGGTICLRFMIFSVCFGLVVKGDFLFLHHDTTLTL